VIRPIDLNSRHLQQALAVVTVSKLRSYLQGQLDRFELIADIVQRHMDRAVEIGTLLEVLPQVEFRALCKQTLTLTAQRER